MLEANIESKKRSCLLEPGIPWLEAHREQTGRDPIVPGELSTTEGSQCLRKLMNNRADGINKTRGPFSRK